jgi:hypothetical protein
MNRYTLFLAAALMSSSALAQQQPQQSAPPPSPEQQRADYCIDTVRQRDILNGYANNLLQQVTKLTSDLKEAQDKLKGTEDAYDAYKKAHPAEEKTK